MTTPDNSRLSENQTSWAGGLRAGLVPFVVNTRGLLKKLPVHLSGLCSLHLLLSLNSSKRFGLRIRRDNRAICPTETCGRSRLRYLRWQSQTRRWQCVLANPHSRHASASSAAAKECTFFSRRISRHTFDGQRHCKGNAKRMGLAST